MCEPTTLIIAATAVAAAGQVVSGIQKANAAKYEAKVAESNVKLATNQANDAMARTKEEQQRSFRKTAQLVGSQRAAMAANGIELGFGTAVDTIGDSKRIGQEEVNIIGRSGAREAMGYDIDAANYSAKADAARMAKKAAVTETVFGVGKTLLGGAQQYRRAQAG